MDQEKSIKYDAEGDILEIFLAENKPCVAFDLDDDIFIRMDPETNELVSLSILGFLNHMQTKNIPAQVPKEWITTG